MANYAYYNEWDKDAAEWIRQLIKLRVIPEGEVDERSISDIAPSDLRGFRQCHFFAGIGVWAYALRRAGYSDEEDAWTGSCPCQSFSAAGKRKGFDDERHLWPDWFWLIEVCRPKRILGEQVSSRDALAWIDLVSADLEGIGYSVGALAPCSAGVGAPCIRERLYWVACAETPLRRRARGENERRRGLAEAGGPSGTIGLVQSEHDAGWPNVEGPGSQGRTAAGRPGTDGRLVRPSHERRQCQQGLPRDAGEGSGQGDARGEPGDGRLDGRLASSEGERSQEVQPDRRLRAERHHQPGPTNGFWADCDWALCRDERKGVLRPTLRPFEPEPVTLALADGSAEGLGPGGEACLGSTFPLSEKEVDRAMRLRGYGNAVNAEVASLFARIARRQTNE